MKLSVAIADTTATANAFVVFRGFEASIRQAARLGYDGVELALKLASEVDRAALRGWLGEAGIEVSCISTGQVFAALGLTLSAADAARRAEAQAVFRDLVDLASEFGGMVNIGRARGSIGVRPRSEVEGLFLESVGALCEYAAPRGVTLLVEPVNRYEIDFINSVEDGAALLDRLGAPNLKLMPDVFHMNIEDRTIGGELARHARHVGYVHLADSNRLAPGWGHTDFSDVFRGLRASGYDGWVSVEILPRPDPDSAAKQAAEYLRPYVCHR
jgi:sugar phosphate isomerase/epimerase